MKIVSLISGLVFMAGVAGVAMAGTQTMSITVTNGQPIAISSAIPVSGVLDKIEVCQSAGATSTVTVANYVGDTATEVFVNLSGLVGNKVVRPRFAPTDATGAVLTNASVSRVSLGGTTKMSVTDAGCTTNKNTVVVTIYFEKAPMIAW